MATTFTRRFDRVFAPFDRLLAALTDPARRERAVIAVLLGYVAVWTLYAILAKASQDMHPDVGELVYHGPNVMMGYAHTSADLALGKTVDNLRTGDVARRTPDGLYEVIGRSSRLSCAM